MNILIATK